MSQQLQLIDAPADSRALTPMQMIERALEHGAAVETLEKLMALQERWEAGQARKAFNAAMAKAKAKFLPVLKRKSGYANRYKFESLDDVIAAVDPALTKHGFTYDWMTEDLETGRIRVTCIVTHKDGHSKSNSLSGDPQETADAKANMNAFQRMGGAVTYLQRYTIKAALGIAASEDTDIAPPESADFDEMPYLEKIDAMTTDNIRAVQEALNADANKMPASKFKLIKAHFAARMKRLQEMANAD